MNAPYGDCGDCGAPLDGPPAGYIGGWQLVACPECDGLTSVRLGDNAPTGTTTHPVRAQDVPALLPKVIG